MEYGVKEGIEGSEERFDEVTAPGASGRRGTLEDMFICFFGCVASWTAVVVTCVSAMEAFTRREIEETELGNKIASLFEFRVDATKGFPIYRVVGTVIPVESLFVVGNELG